MLRIIVVDVLLILLLLLIQQRNHMYFTIIADAVRVRHTAVTGTRIITSNTHPVYSPVRSSCVVPGTWYYTRYIVYMYLVCCKIAIHVLRQSPFMLFDVWNVLRAPQCCTAAVSDLIMFITHAYYSSMCLLVPVLTYLVFLYHGYFYFFRSFFRSFF